MGTQPATGSAGRALLERERELGTLAELVDAAIDGDGRCALIEGPAGIGKSRLLAEGRVHAEGRMQVLSARGSDLEREFPFGVVRQLFEGLVARPDDRERLLAGAAGPAAAAFAAPAGPDADDGLGDASFATLHGLFWLALNVVETRPLLLSVDDLHWTDRASLRFLTYLVRRLEGVPILIATTLRTAEPGTDMALISELAHDPATTALQPGSLSPEAVRQLVRERLDAAADDAFSDACHTATGGNPLLLRQLLTALEADGVSPATANAGVVSDIGPRAVSRTVLPRLARLPVETVAVARALAVLGEGASLPVVATLAGVDEEDVASATAALARAEVLSPDPPLGFVHPLVHEAIYRDLPPGQRELEHARAAHVLRDAGAPDDRVAAQLLLTPARGEAWVVELLKAASRAAIRSGAPDSATAYLRRALAEPPPAPDRPQLLFDLGMAEAMTNGPAAAEHLRAAYDELDDPGARAAAAGIIGRTLMFTDRPDEAAAIADEAIAMLPPEYEDERRALEAFAVMTVYFGGTGVDRVKVLPAYRRPPETDGVGERMLMSMAAHDWMSTDGSVDEAAELALAALADGQLLQADSGLLALAAVAPLMHGDRDEAMEALDAAIADGYRRGSLYVVSSIHLWRGYTLWRRGDLGEAEEQLRAALEEFELWGFGETALVHTRAFLTQVLRDQGNLAAARAQLDLSAGHVRGRDNHTGWLHGAEHGVLLAEGRAEEALAAAEALGRIAEAVPDPSVLWWRSMRAEALDRLERGDEARACALEELEVTRAFGAPSPLGRTLRVLGIIERDDGIAHLEESVAVLDGSPARLEHAKSLAALGAALRRSRKPTEARDPLRRALELASACGANGLADEVRSELHATGLRPRSDALGGVESLTPSERRVSGLAAEGSTNREIAQTLYVTPKTVEVHLSNAYRKLGIRSRRELVGALAA